MYSFDTSIAAEDYECKFFKNMKLHVGKVKALLGFNTKILPAYPNIEALALNVFKLPIGIKLI